MKESYLNYHYTNFSDKSEWIFVTPSFESRDMRTTVQEVGHFYFSGAHYTERGPLNSYQITFSLRRTEGTLILPGGEVFPFVNERETLLLDCTKGYRINTENEGDSIFVHFWNPDFRYYYDQFLRMNNNSPFMPAYNPLVENNLRALLGIYRSANGYQTDVYAEALIMEMIFSLIKMATPGVVQGYSAYVRDAISYIKARYAENIKLEDLAAGVHISKYYLSHLFKKETGMTPANYLQQYRISKAKELLRTTDLNQEMICAQIGLYNCSHLGRLFRSYEGCTPDQYRKMWMNAAGE